MTLRRFHFSSDTDAPRTVVVMADAPHDAMTFNCSPAALRYALRKYDRGELVQDALSFLTVDEREFLMTGLTPEAWSESFGEPAHNDTEEENLA